MREDETLARRFLERLAEWAEGLGGLEGLEEEGQRVWREALFSHVRHTSSHFLCQ